MNNAKTATTTGNTSKGAAAATKPNTSPKPAKLGTVSGQKTGEFSKPHQTVRNINELSFELTLRLNPTIASDRRQVFQAWVKEGVTLEFRENIVEGTLLGASIWATRPNGEGVTSQREEVRLEGRDYLAMGQLQAYVQEYSTMKEGGNTSGQGNTSSTGGRGRMSADAHGEIARLYKEEGLSLAQIATKVNRKTEVIEASLKKSGVALRSEAVVGSNA